MTEAEVNSSNIYKKKKETVLEIEFIKPPENYDDPAECQLPPNVSFKRVITNILNATNNSSNAAQKRDKDKMQILRNYLESEENKSIFSDAFWYMICKTHSRDGEYPEVEFTLLERMSKNFVKLLLTVPDNEKGLVFDVIKCHNFDESNSY